MEEWKNGSMFGRVSKSGGKKAMTKDGRMEGWKDERMEGRVEEACKRRDGQKERGKDCRTNAWGSIGPGSWLMTMTRPWIFVPLVCVAMKCSTPLVEVSPKEARHISMQTRTF